MDPAENIKASTLPEASKNEAENAIPTEKDLVTWKAPARPFKRRNREFYVTIIVIALIVGLILFFTEGFMPVVLLISLIFLFYILSTVEPETIEYRITTKGIYIANKITEMENFKRFWFSRRYDSQLLVLETYIIPGRLEYVIEPEKKEEIRKALLKYLPLEESSPSALDKTANWLSKKLPGNRE